MGETRNNIPKEVRFAVENPKELEDAREEAKDREDEEVVIKFDTDHQGQDNMSALSQSVGKRWKDEESIVVWETRKQEGESESRHRENNKVFKIESQMGTDHKSVNQLRQNLEDRESEDTNSME